MILLCINQADWVANNQYYLHVCTFNYIKDAQRSYHKLQEGKQVDNYIIFVYRVFADRCDIYRVNAEKDFKSISKNSFIRIDCKFSSSEPEKTIILGICLRDCYLEYLGFSCFAFFLKIAGYLSQILGFYYNQKWILESFLLI